jgi:hypothetical protein
MHNSHAQTGSITAVFTDQFGKSSNITINEPVFDATSTVGYWFIQSSTGKRRFSLAPQRYYADGKTSYQVPFIELYLNGDENDVNAYSYSYNESKNYVGFKTESMGIVAPNYDYRNTLNNHPLKIHINSFTSTEIDFDFRGAVSYTFNNSTSAGNYGTGKLEGHVHLYRKAGYYGKSDVLAGCNCDPTIYLWFYDREENSTRSASACEYAFQRKIYKHMQQAMQPVFQLDYGGKGKLQTGEVSVNNCTNCKNTNKPVIDEDVCNGADTAQSNVPVGSEKSFFKDGDYGIRMISSPDAGMPDQGTTKSTGDKIKELMIAYQNKQITAEELQQQTKAMQNNQQLKKENADFKKAESLNDMSFSFIINPNNESAYAIINNAATAQVQHNIPQAVAEVFSPSAQNSDGSWSKDVLTVYMGKFSPVTIGKNSYGHAAGIAKTTYPANGNKLSCYGIIITFKGDKRLIDKAVAAMNWASLSDFLSGK